MPSRPEVERALLRVGSNPSHEEAERFYAQRVAIVPSPARRTLLLGLAAGLPVIHTGYERETPWPIRARRAGR